MARFEFVVSAENTDDLAWQAMLFHYSCVTHNSQPAVVVVHSDGGPLAHGFRRIRESGGIVQTAPNFRRVNGVNYPPRNTAGSLQCVETDADYIVLCDPDMVFLTPFPCARYRVRADEVTFDHVHYMTLDDLPAGDEPYVEMLRHVCERRDVPFEFLGTAVTGGVPHVIPRGVARALSREWQVCTEEFPRIDPHAGPLSRECHVGPQLPWLATMWAAVIAARRLGLQAVPTRLAILNKQSRRELATARDHDEVMIHYCYADTGFDKFRYTSASEASEVWNAAAPAGSVSEEVCRQLRAAGSFYRL